jgi:nascent polypeptide-associated complex subunit beta
MWRLELWDVCFYSFFACNYLTIFVSHLYTHTNPGYFCSYHIAICYALPDDKKITAVVKKLGATVLPGVEEVNMFRNDNSVLHFPNPKVQSAVQSNTFVVSGTGLNKDISELLPGIISQLGPDNMENLRALAEQFQAQAGKAAAATEGEDEDDDDDIPDLVENFEETSKN